MPTFIPPELLSGMQTLGLPQSFGTVPQSSATSSLNASYTRSSSGSPGQWSGDDSESTTNFWRDLCQCGDNCGCPGCFQHGNSQLPPGVLPSQTCANPERCVSCFNCTTESLIRSTQGMGPFPLDPALEVPMPATFESGANMGLPSYFGNRVTTSDQGNSTDDFAANMGFLPQMMSDGLSVGDPMAYDGSMLQQSMSGLMPSRNCCRRCYPGQCVCGPNRCNCDHVVGTRSDRRDRSLTFATSGERPSCCGGGGSSGSGGVSSPHSPSTSQSQGRSSSSAQPSRPHRGKSSSSNVGQMQMPTYGDPSPYGAEAPLNFSVSAPFPVSLSPSSQHFAIRTSHPTNLVNAPVSMSTMRTPSAASHSSGSESSGSRRGSASDSSTSGSGRKLVRGILPKGPVVFPDYD